MYKSSSILERLTSHSFLVQKEEGTAKLEINSCHNFQIQNRNQGKEFVRSNEMKNIRGIFKIILQKTDKLPLVGKMWMISSWGNLKKTLLSLAAKINNLKKLKLEDLPKQRGSNDVTIPDYQTDFLVQAKKSLSGDVYEEEPIEGDLSEIDEGLNLVVDT